MASKGSKPFKYRDRWRIVVTLNNGERRTKDFDHRADAVLWGAQQTAIANEEHEPVLDGLTRTTVAAALEHYGRLYSVHKGGVVAELARINRYLVAAGMSELAVTKTDEGGIAVVPRAPRATQPGLQAHVDQRRAKRTGTNAMRDSLALKTCNRLTTASLREFYALMTQEGLGESTIQKEFAMLKTMFNVAATEWNWGNFKNPLTPIKLGKSKRRFVKLDATQRASLDAALAECENPYFWPLVVVAKETTLRRKTLLELRWDDVDLDERTSLASTKTGQMVHKFSKPVVQLLRTLPRDPSGRIFPLSENAVTQAWNRVRMRANLPNLQYRDLRHLGATDWVRRGIKTHVLQKVLGHSSIATAQYYVDLVDDDVGEALDAAMARSAPLSLPPPGLPDAKAQQTQNAVRRLQRAVAQKRAGVEEEQGGQGQTSPELAQRMEVPPLASTPVARAQDATELFLNAQAESVTGTSVPQGVGAVSNVISFRPRRAA